MRYRRTNRFDAAVVAAVALVALGTVLGNAKLVAGAVVPLGYLAAGALTGPPAVSSLTVERSFEPELAAPGRPTTVTVAVTNEGGRTLPDVRVADRPPERLAVVGGTARGCLSIRPGETATISYEVVASQGDHEFDAPLVRLRPLPAVGEATGRTAVVGGTTLRCRRSIGRVPKADGALRRIGTQPSDRPGDGIEFHSVREYRHGDDIGRIDWRSLAKTGELSTVDFREPSATEVVVVVDGRAPGHCIPGAGYPTATGLSAYAADRVAARLLAADNRVSVTALGVSVTDLDSTLPSDSRGRPWTPPGTDAAARMRIDAVLDAVVTAGEVAFDDPTLAATDGGSRRLDPVEIRERMPRSADVVLATPALDDAPLELVEALTAAGYHVLVVSPDITGGDRPGARLAAVERRQRLRRLRESDAAVVDWNTAEPLAAVLEVAP